MDDASHELNCFFLSAPIRFCWQLIWHWTAETPRRICGIGYVEMNIWLMLFKNAITAQRKYYSLLLMERVDSGRVQSLDLYAYVLS